MLVVLRIDARSNQGAELRVCLPRAQLIGAELAGELDLVLNGAVLLEVPVEQIPARKLQSQSTSMIELALLLENAILEMWWTSYFSALKCHNIDNCR